MKKEFFKDKLDRLDPLTKIFERSVLEEYALELVRHKLPFMFCFVDIDNFKNINDNYGHKFGDVVLTEFAKTLKKLTSNIGYVSRYGGDEFVVIIP